MHMNQGNNATTQPKDNIETSTVMVHSVHINETTTLFLPTEEDWMQAKSEDHDLRYINRIIWSGLNTC